MARVIKLRFPEASLRVLAGSSFVMPPPHPSARRLLDGSDGGSTAPVPENTGDMHGALRVDVARGVPVAQGVPVQAGGSSVAHGSPVTAGIAAGRTGSGAAQQSLRSDCLCLLLLSLPQARTLQGFLGIVVAFAILYSPPSTRQSSSRLGVLRAFMSLIQVLCALAILRSCFSLAHISKHPPEICSNTCLTASDGECDDAGGDSVYDTCSLGTDCVDCGSRVYYREAFVFFIVVTGLLSLSLMVCAARVSLRTRALQLLQLMQASETLV